MEGEAECTQAGTRVCTAHVKMSGRARARVSLLFFLSLGFPSLPVRATLRPSYNKTTEAHEHTRTGQLIHTHTHKRELRRFAIQF